MPLLNASLTDGAFEVERPAAGPLAGIPGHETPPLVSSDYRGDPRPAIVDAALAMATNGTQVKVYAWHDNEWGHACRLADVARLVAQSL